jgi:hypothetical protein
MVRSIEHFQLQRKLKVRSFCAVAILDSNRLPEILKWRPSRTIDPSAHSRAPIDASLMTERAIGRLYAHSGPNGSPGLDQ